MERPRNSKESESESLSRVQLSAIPWTVAHQDPLSMGFSRQEYCSELSFASPGNLPDPGIELRSPALQADTLPSESPGDLFFILFLCDSIRNNLKDYFLSYQAREKHFSKVSEL